MKTVVTNKVLKSKASSASLQQTTAVNRDTAKLSKTSVQEEECHPLARESSKLSQISSKSNVEDSSNKDQTRLSQKSNNSVGEIGSYAQSNPSNKLPQAYTDNLTDLEDNQSKNSSLDSGTGSCSQHDTQSGSGSHKQLPNNHLVQNPKSLKKTAGDVSQAKPKHKKLEASSPSHSDVEQRKSARSTSVNAIELTQVDESKA